MKKQNRVNLAVLVVLLLAYVAAEYAAPKEIDWDPSFDPDKRAPFGTFVVTRLLQSAYPGARVVTTGEPLFTLLRRRDRFPHPFNLLIVNRSLSREAFGVDFSIDPFDAETLLDFVEHGGSVLLAAESFGGALADSLNLETSIWSVNPLLPSARVLAPGRSGMTDSSGTGTETVDLLFASESLQSLSFRVEDRLARWYFSSVDSARTNVVGTVVADGDTLATFVRVDRGSGRFFITTLPYLFTNYALVDTTMSGWSFAALSHLPIQTTVWNANYIPGRGQASSTPLRYVLSNEALRWAWYLTFASALLFVLFRAKRRQRIIPVVEPNRNVTLEFADSIGRLYYQRGNHRDLAEKKIAHFFDYVRSHLGIVNHDLAEAQRTRIASRAGVPTEVIDQIAAFISDIEGRAQIDGNLLVRLSRAIDEFYRLAKR